MWHVQLSKREFVELCLGSFRSIEGRVKRASAVLAEGDATAIDAFWDSEPSGFDTLPNLLVVPDDGATEVLTTINSLPQTANPITAFCRVVTRSEAQAYFTTTPVESHTNVLPVIVALIMAEAVLHSDGRVGLAQLSPAICKRTLSYAWGRALSARVPGSSLETLPARWMDAYALINANSAIEPVRRTISTMVGALSVATQISVDIRPKDPAGALAYAAHRKDRNGQEAAWRELSKVLENPVSLEVLANATREERGLYLQHALRASSGSQPDISETLAAAPAFIATQVAPGSLEHYELLRNTSRQSTLTWYALFAALQSPQEILASQGGLGLRLLRDLARVEEHLSRPVADIGFIELKALERAGIDSIARKLGHSGEVEVELIPLVTSSFTYHSKNVKNRTETSQQLTLDTDHYAYARPRSSSKAQIVQVLTALSQLVQDLPDNDDDSTSAASRRSRKR